MLISFSTMQTGFILSKQAFDLEYKMTRAKSVANILTWADYKIQTYMKSWGGSLRGRWFAWANLHLACFCCRNEEDSWGSGEPRGVGRVFWCLPNLHLSGPGGAIGERLSFLQLLVTKCGLESVRLSPQASKIPLRLSLRFGTLGSIQRKPENGR